MVVAVLTVQGSYANGTEVPAVGIPDTVQFWLAPDGAWRIRTFAMDHDIHLFSLGGAAHADSWTTDFALEQITKHYAEVTAIHAVLPFVDPNDESEVQRVLTSHGLTGSLEVSTDRVAFYNPDRGEYSTQTEPDEIPVGAPVAHPSTSSG